jgi:hypothetical protein
VYPTNPECRTYEREARVVGQGSPKGVCIFGDDSLKIGYYSDGGVYVGVVSFAYSGEFYVLEGVCGGSWRCQYSAANDTLVTLQQVSQYGVGMVIYRNVKERISRLPGPTGDRFVFDATNPAFSIKNDQDRYIWTPTYALSENGKWVAAELRDKGVAIVDTESFEVRQISTIGFAYGYGRDPTVRLAVANDGGAVLVTGTNAGMSMIDTSKPCGQPLIGELRLQPGAVDCPSIDLLGYASFPNFSFADLPRFIGDGKTAELVVHSWVDGVRRVTFLAHGANASHELQFLSLGDSFSSGEGETDARFYIPGTNDGVDTCHVSSRAYPLLIAGLIGVDSPSIQSVACSGARIKDIIGSSDVYWGQSGRLGPMGLGMSAQDKAAAQSKALETFQPGRTLQSDFLDRYNPEIIMLGVGGNDAGLMGKVRACAMPGTCEWATGQGKQATAKEIDRLSTSLTDLFGYITKHSPSSRVYVSGYPIAFSDQQACDPVTKLLFDQTEREFISQSIIYLNQVIKAAVAKTPFTYVDIEKSLGGKELCSSAPEAAVNGLLIGGDVAPISSIPSIKLISAGSFHPNPLGHQMIAQTILNDYPSLLIPGAEDGCVDPTMCEVFSPGAQTSSYWNETAGPIGPEAYFSEFAVYSADSNSIEVSLPAGNILPESNVRIELHSNPVLLKELSAGVDGRVSATVEVPNDTPDGIHTLHLYGVNREGREVDLYQFYERGIAEASIREDSGLDPVIAVVSKDTRSTVLGAAPLLPEQAISRPDILGAGDIPSRLVASKQSALVIKPEASPANWWIAIWLAGGLLLAAIIAFLIFRRWAKPGT